MTIETTVNKTIQSGNGSNKDFDFAFEIPDEDSLSLTKRASDGTETAITTNFTVTGIGDESGGSVNYPTSGSALTSSEKIIIKRVISLKQLENLRNQGDYSLEDIEDALDRAVMMCQQLQEQIDRCLKLNLTSSSTYVNVDDFVANRLLVVSSDGQSIEMSSAEYGSIDAYLSTLVAIADDISTVAGIAADVTTVAGIDTDVTTVAGIASDVSAVAAIDSDVTQVSSIHAAVSTVSSINAAVSTVAGISANVTTVAGISSNVTTVAGISSAVSNVSSISSAVSTVSGISSAVSTVASISSAVSSVSSNATNINTVAGIATAVSTVASISANVSTVAGISANVTTVAGMSASIASVVANMTSIQNAASFGFPTATSGDVGKHLELNQTYNGYNFVSVIQQTSNKGLAYSPNAILHKINSSDPNNDVDFSAGVIYFDDGTGQALATALTKRLDASWSAGNNNGGIDTGSKASGSTYFLHAIWNPTTSTADFVFSLSATSPTMPSGYTKSMRIGSVVTDGSGNLYPDRFYYNLVTQRGQIVTHQYSDAVTTTTTIPFDNTIPQIGEGGQMMSVNITPKKSTSWLIAKHIGYYESSTATRIIAAMFKAGGADAVAAGRGGNISSQGTPAPIVLEHQGVSGSTSAIAFAVRAGPDSAATVTFNGTGGGRSFGGVSGSILTILEESL